MTDGEMGTNNFLVQISHFTDKEKNEDSQSSISIQETWLYRELFDCSGWTHWNKTNFKKDKWWSWLGWFLL